MKAQITMAAIRASQSTLGSVEATWLTGTNASDAACAGPEARAIAAAHRNASTGITSLLPACQFLPAISHPRGFQRPSVWPDGFGSGKRVLAYLNKLT